VGGDKCKQKLWVQGDFIQVDAGQTVLERTNKRATETGRHAEQEASETTNQQTLVWKRRGALLWENHPQIVTETTHTQKKEDKKIPTGGRAGKQTKLTSQKGSSRHRLSSSTERRTDRQKVTGTHADADRQTEELSQELFLRDKPQPPLRTVAFFPPPCRLPRGFVSEQRSGL